MKEVLNGHFFNEEYYFSLKSTYRPKFLHIGLKFWETLISEVISNETSAKTKTKLIQALLSPEYIRVFVRSMSMQKGILFDVATSVKATMLKSLEKAEISASLAQQLLSTFFGPNSNQKLALKRN